MINTMENLIDKCKNKAIVVGVLYELALFFKKKNNSVVLEYKGVVQTDNTFIHINGCIYEKDRAFYNFLDDFGISYELTQNILHKKYSTSNNMVTARILSIYIEEDNVFTGYNTYKNTSIYASGRVCSGGRIKVQYIRTARVSDSYGIDYELVGIPYKQDNNNLEILIADDYHNQSIIIPSDINPDLGYLDLINLKWGKLKIENDIVENIYETKVFDSNVIDSIKPDLIEQVKTEYDIFIEAIRGR